MDESHLETVRSFKIVIFDNELRKCVAATLPLSITAPFLNRLIQEVIPSEANQIREPWYLLIPHCSHQAALLRAVQPEGPTSLYSKRYDPESEPLPRVTLHPQAH